MGYVCVGGGRLDLLLSMSLCLPNKSQAKLGGSEGMELENELCFLLNPNGNTFFGAERVWTDSLPVPLPETLGPTQFWLPLCKDKNKA